MGNPAINTYNAYKEHFIDLAIYQSGREKCTPGHSYGPASREHYLFHYVISGEGKLETYPGTYLTPVESFAVNAGQGYLIHPGQLATYAADLQNPWTYIWVEFDGLRAKELLQQTELGTSQPIYRASDEKQRDQMVKEMTYIVEHPDSSICDIIGHTYLFFDLLVRSSGAVNGHRVRRMRDQYVRAAVGYIEQNFHRKIPIEELAAICGIDRSYFGKIFRDAVGHSPQEFITQYRMIKASELLCHTDLSITDIASAVSYDNPLHFSRAFKRVRGVSPRTWRNQQPAT